MSPRPIRPRLVHVERSGAGWQMELAFPGSPTRWISVRVKGGGRTKREAATHAHEELAALTRAELELLYQSATPGPAIPRPEQLALVITAGSGR